MKKHLKTLFITTQGTCLAKDGECVLVRVEREDKARIPIHTLGGLVCFGQVSLCPPAPSLRRPCFKFRAVRADAVRGRCLS